MDDVLLTMAQARRFMLMWQGLAGDYTFDGVHGALDYVRRVGCVQFDPVDVCGRNADLVLQSRVRGYDKDMLAALLYEERALVDYFDKNLSIVPVEDWPYFARERDRHREWERSHLEIEAVRGDVRRAIAERGPLSSADLDMPDKVRWYWSDTRLSRAALEHMYFTGELAVHHKKGGVKYYDLIENCLPADVIARGEPLPDEHAHRRWRVARRIRAVGLLWNRASDAWLCIDGLNAEERAACFDELAGSGDIVRCRVEGMKAPLYAPAAGAALLAACMEPLSAAPRCEFIAPLDDMLWDRKLIKALFDFDYKWEIYTPAEKRRYGHYVLPLLYGERFVGRAELVRDGKRAVLEARRFWYEDGFAPDAAFEAALCERLKRFARFNGCTGVTRGG